MSYLFIFISGFLFNSLVNQVIRFEAGEGFSGLMLIKLLLIVVTLLFAVAWDEHENKVPNKS